MKVSNVGQIKLSNARLTDVVVLASLGCNLALACVIHRDRTPRIPPGPQVGQMVGTITGADDSGAALAIPSDPQGRPSVLYVFSQSCEWCQKTIPALRTLFPAKKARFRFVAVDISAPFAPAKPYLTANGLEFERTIHPDPETRARLGVSGTPTTIVVDPSGRIVKAFDGALIGSTFDSASKFFGTALRASESPASVDVAQSLAAIPHTFKNGCTQDGLAFSFGAQICRQSHTYSCAPAKGWEEADSECGNGMYTAKERPGQ